MNLLIKHVLLRDRRVDVLIEGNTISAVADHLFVDEGQVERVIEGNDYAIFPALYNTHTHAAMMLLRGLADDMPLMEWLSEHIWPFEAKMQRSDFDEGNQLAIQEMKESGTAFFNDMYFEQDSIVQAVLASGMRAAVGLTILEGHPKADFEQQLSFLKAWKDPTHGRLQLVVSPHAIYTVSREQLSRAADVARENHLKLHIHLSETQKEVGDCVKMHGVRPVEYLDNLGLLGPDLIAAHCVHINQQEADVLAERGVSVAHCPCSNMKLGSGVFPYERMIRAGVRVCLGTDGASSGNNLDMREAMKFAALLAKSGGDAALLPAEQVLAWATENGAAAFGIKAGRIEPGYLADFMLVDLTDSRMRPLYNATSNLVYAADRCCIKYVFCDGEIIHVR
ncbi:MAG: amidohydrolase [Bacteroidales bacterium]|nr:amidohydrolase [Bacteroidales bacterium]